MRPTGGLRFWAPSRDHGNPIPHTDLIKAITQAHRYLYEIEQEANSLLKRHLERSIPHSTALVLNRNNSADRLEPATPISDPGLPSALPIIGGPPQCG